jgi:ATP-dependent protease Clp ATPase subunit
MKIDFRPSIDKKNLKCSFCGKHNVAELITGQSACICDECIMLCHEAVTGENGYPKIDSQTHTCSFCGKSVQDKILSGPRVFICFNCVDKGAELIIESQSRGI